jgi:hypothetical protein
MTGTRVRLGNTYLDESNSNFLLSPRGLQFSVPAALIAATAPKLVNRDGYETDILQLNDQVGGITPQIPACDGKIPGPIPDQESQLVSTEQPRPAAPIQGDSAPPQIVSPPKSPTLQLDSPNTSDCPQARSGAPASSQVLICKVTVDSYTDTQSILVVGIRC